MISRYTIISFASILLLCIKANTQAINYGNFYMPSGSIAYLNGSFTNNPSVGQKFENNGELSITGNFSNSEVAMSAGSGTMRFIGSSLQQILGTETPVFFDLELSNSSNLQQAVDVEVLGNFDLTNGAWQMSNQTLNLIGSIDNISNTGTISGSASSNLVIGGVSGGNIGNLFFTSGARQLNNLNMNRSGVNPSVTIGTDLNVSGNFNFTSGNFTIGANTLTLSGSLTGAGGTFTGSTSSNLIIAGNSSSLGTISFTSGSRTLNNLSLQRTGVGANAAAVLGTPLSVNGIDLQNGILATGNNLFTWTRTGSLTPIAQTSYTSNSTNYKNSYICLCTGIGSALSFTSPFDAADNIGFRVNNVTTNVWLPIGVDFDAPNRVRINNTGAADDLTFLLAKGDIGGTDKPVVRRIWYAYEAVPGGTTADMNLYFTKRDPAQFGITQDEIETGFDYADITLTQKNYGDPNYIDVAQNGDILNGIGNTIGSEIYGQYFIGVSPDVNTNTDGINQFSRFSVMNIGSFILPVRWLSFTANAKDQNAVLSWIVAEEKNVASYTIEKSTDGVVYFPLGNVSVSQNNINYNQYSFTDYAPQKSKNYYRIKLNDLNGSSTYSKVQTLDFGQQNKVVITPNPIINNYCNLSLTDLSVGVYALELFNTNGISVLKQNINHSLSGESFKIGLPSFLNSGWYIFILANKNVQYKIPVYIQE